MNRIKRYFQSKNNITFAAALLLVSIVGCEKYVIPSTQIDPKETLYFQSDILPIFAKNNCSSCHGGALKPDLRPENAYNSLSTGGYIDTKNPASSKLYNHPSHEAKTTADEKKYILYWITQGALNN